MFTSCERIKPEATSTQRQRKGLPNNKMHVTRVTAKQYFTFAKRSKGLQYRKQTASHKGDHTKVFTNHSRTEVLEIAIMHSKGLHK